VQRSGNAVAYHLEAAAAGADDQGPGVAIESGKAQSGAVSGRHVDVVDIYRFDVTRLSTVRVDSGSSSPLDVELTTVTGDPIAKVTSGTSIRQTLKAGSYLVTVTAPPRGGAHYTITALVRVVTTTGLTANGHGKARVGVGEPVALATTTDPAPEGGKVQVRVDYHDPRAGWVYRQSWLVAPGEQVTFTPPAVGAWRAVASYGGTRSWAPSHSKWVDLTVTAVKPAGA